MTHERPLTNRTGKMVGVVLQPKAEPEQVRSIEQLLASIRQRLGAHKDTIKAWTKGRPEMDLDSFVAAVSQLPSIKISPAAAGALFRTLSGGSSKMPVKMLQRRIWGGGGDGQRAAAAAAAASKAVALAVQLGVKPAETTKDDSASQKQFAPTAHCASEVDRFAWESGPAAPYWMSGDPKYDSPEALERRVALLRSGRVVRACRQFWDTLMLGEGDTLEQVQYKQVHRLLTKALAPQMGEAEWREAAAEDWRDDLRGQPAMTMALYLMSIFEIADLWTDSVEEWQYVVFINKLYRRVTKPKTDEKKSKQNKKKWRMAGASAMLQAAQAAASAGGGGGHGSGAAGASGEASAVVSKLSMAAVIAAARRAGGSGDDATVSASYASTASPSIDVVDPSSALVAAPDALHTSGALRATNSSSADEGQEAAVAAGAATAMISSRQAMPTAAPTKIAPPTTTATATTTATTTRWLSTRGCNDAASSAASV